MHGELKDAVAVHPENWESVKRELDERSGQVDHLRSALTMLHKEAARDWLEGVKSDACLDALEYASRTLAATKERP